LDGVLSAPTIKGFNTKVGRTAMASIHPWLQLFPRPNTKGGLTYGKKDKASLYVLDGDLCCVKEQKILQKQLICF
jgi:hypothetical protein